MIAEQSKEMQNLHENVMHLEGVDDSNDEIQRYMHGRGCSKRHTVGCTDEFSAGKNGDNSPHMVNSPIPACSPTTSAGASTSGSGGRTRRTGLLTVMERPPGKS
jgi:serine/threonine-protein kinase SIK3